MIYGYPEEFVVPVIYSEELKENPMYREWELKYLQMEKVVEPYKKMKEYEIFTKGEYDEEQVYSKNSVKKGMDFLEFDEEISYQKPYEDEICGECMKDEHMKNILNEIDDEYVKSETLGM
jgi:hypothetical protein